jgi:hypothetical protein
MDRPYNLMRNSGPNHATDFSRDREPKAVHFPFGRLSSRGRGRCDRNLPNGANPGERALRDGSSCGEISAVVIGASHHADVAPRNRGLSVASSSQEADDSVLSRLDGVAGFGPWRFGQRRT